MTNHGIKTDSSAWFAQGMIEQAQEILVALAAFQKSPTHETATALFELTQAQENDARRFFDWTQEITERLIDWDAPSE